MKRREFIKKTSSAVALVVATGGTAWFFDQRQSSRYIQPGRKTQSFEVAPEPSIPQVALSRDEDSIAALHKALNAVGGTERFIQPGERVTIKPNIGWDRTEAQAANTSPVLVGEMVRLCLAAGAAQVVVTDVSCNDPRRCFQRSGIGEAAKNAGASVLLPSEDDFVTMHLGGKLLTAWPVLSPFVNTDRLINMPIVKQHSLTSCTIAMKNLYGILGGPRHQLHQQIDQSIVDLAAFCRPTLTVVDATRILMRSGPQGGSLDDVNIEHTVICATDQVAADSRACEFLGLSPDRVGHIVLAAKTGLGSMDYRAAGYREIA